MEQNYDPSSDATLHAVIRGNPADTIITAANLDDWLIKLDFSDSEEATLFALTVNKCFEYKEPFEKAAGQIKTVGEQMAQEVLRIAKSRSAIDAKRSKLYADVVSGIMAMALRRRQDRDGSDNRAAR